MFKRFLSLFKVLYRTHVTYLKNEQKNLLYELSKKEIPKISEHKAYSEIIKLQKHSETLYSLNEELDIYQQLLKEITDSKESYEERLKTNEDIIHLNYNIENITNLIIEDIILFYKSYVNKDHHLDATEIKMEITAGVGGLEAKMFAKELFHMYENFCKVRNYEYEIKDTINDESKENKNIVLYIRGNNVYEDFYQENGIHRVQRVPINSKKVQTSTSVVFIFDEKKQKDNIMKKIKFSKNDLIIETKRSGGAGGQSVNKNETCVKIIHKHTKIFVEVQKTSSQIQNKNIAMQLLKDKLYNFYYELEKNNFLKDKKNQKLSADRSHKIRTYNFLHNVIIDHITNTQYSGIQNFFKGDMLIQLINKKKQLYYQNIIDQTIQYIFSLINSQTADLQIHPKKK
ncbi:peptide release factor, putative [Plasmodium sp. gorilla clade G2]|uniref:peptide release factor, putative n=1 Tax=Plasmodium sp. gorilla clade G2 TaxID=880535 RepID=UPI000D219CA6|nr:peptide release factor, putative [Plasmodium sp. gorilla clade G2]SOV14497.1 peptide release factor, putative [Plasmodium sp. gorilla clade G2]